MHPFAAALLLVPLVATSQPTRLFDPPKTDDSPTAFACTAETLAKGADCTFEGQDGPASAAENASRLKQLAESSCDGALRSAVPADAKVLREGCLGRMNAAVQRCSAEGAVVDSAGRFTGRGKSCYRLLADARNQAEAVANAAPNCCECLARNGCSGAGGSCVASASKGNLSAQCNSDACDAACAELMTGTRPPAKTAASARKHAK